MKNLKTILAALMITGSFFTANASNGKGKDSEKNRTVESKVQMVQLPEQFRKPGFDEKVKVLFTVDLAGKVQEVLCICDEPALKASVEKQFSSFQFPAMKENTLYTINISFKVL